MATADNELLALVAHLLRNSATAVLANAEMLRHHAEEMSPETIEAMWARLEGHATAIAEVCGEMIRGEPVLALDRVAELARYLREGADVLGRYRADEIYRAEES